MHGQCSLHLPSDGPALIKRYGSACFVLSYLTQLALNQCYGGAQGELTERWIGAGPVLDQC